MEAGDDVDDKEIKENEQMLEDDEGTYVRRPIVHEMYYIIFLQYHFVWSCSAVY